jgi:uncharacterized protein (TIGR01777 family)
MNITLTGASGFIGQALVARLRAEGHTLRALGRRTVPGLPTTLWDGLAPAPAEALAGADAIVHLAGEPVAQRWDAAVKRRIRDSRVISTRQLVSALGQLAPRPAVLVCASAIGYYGSRGDERLSETSPPGHGFLEDVCVEWEREADAAAALGLRVVKIRIGIVLGAQGGALRQMLPPFRLGLGGPLGGGRQWMSWIHLDDLVELFRFALERPDVSGALNGTAPHPVTNSEFTRELARAVRRPALFPVPALALRLLYGEMARILLASQRVLPEAALGAGFGFRYPELRPALAQILG